jgi:acylphosphatase
VGSNPAFPTIFNSFIRPMVRAHIHFSGTVQGVGFRYTTLSFAQQLSLTGWVQNLPDGRVEITAEGPREQIEELLSRLKGQFASFIQDTQIEWLDTKEEFDRFTIII